MQGFVERLPSYICYSNCFIQLLEPPHLLIIPTHTIFSLLFHGLCTPYPISASYIVFPPSSHENDQAIFYSAPSRIKTVHHPTPIPCLPLSPPLSNFALGNCNPSSSESLSWSSSVSLSLPTFSVTCYKHWIYQTTCKGDPIKFIIVL